MVFTGLIKEGGADLIILISLCKAQHNLQSYFSRAVISFHGARRLSKPMVSFLLTRSLLLIMLIAEQVCCSSWGISTDSFKYWVWGVFVVVTVVILPFPPH